MIGIYFQQTVGQIGEILPWKMLSALSNKKMVLVTLHISVDLPNKKNWVVALNML